MVSLYGRIGLITSEQIRAARAFLRWSSEVLAHRSSIGLATIKRLEASSGIPACNVKTLAAIKSTLEAAGVEFVGTPEDAPGVRLRTVSSPDSSNHA